MAEARNSSSMQPSRSLQARLAGDGAEQQQYAALMVAASACGGRRRDTAAVCSPQGRCKRAWWETAGHSSSMQPSRSLQARLAGDGAAHQQYAPLKFAASARGRRLERGTPALCSPHGRCKRAWRETARNSSSMQPSRSLQARLAGDGAEQQQYAALKLAASARGRRRERGSNNKHSYRPPAEALHSSGAAAAINDSKLGLVLPAIGVASPGPAKCRCSARWRRRGTPAVCSPQGRCQRAWREMAGHSSNMQPSSSLALHSSGMRLLPSVGTSF